MIHSATIVIFFLLSTGEVFLINPKLRGNV